MHENDNILFDRLVDGELSREERRRLLVSLDDRHDGWRNCALAFLESQAWRADVGRFVGDAEPVSLGASGDVTARPRPGGRRMFYHLAIAASLLAAFTLGFAWQKGPVAAPRGATNAGSQIADVAATGDSIASEIPPQRHQTGDALTLWVRDSAGGAQPVHVPLVDAGAVDQRFGVEFRSGWPDAIRERLRQSGYDVQSKRRYAPLWFENGRSLVVPVEDTRIVPVSRPVH